MPFELFHRLSFVLFLIVRFKHPPFFFFEWGFPGLLCSLKKIESKKLQGFFLFLFLCVLTFANTLKGFLKKYFMIHHTKSLKAFSADLSYNLNFDVDKSNNTLLKT